MEHMKLMTWATAALVGGPIMFHRGFKKLWLWRLMSNTPTAKIRSMAMGLVEITGRVMPRSALQAPFSAHACVYWQVDVSVRMRRGWSVIHREQSGQPFYVVDDTGVAMVYPRGGDCRVTFGVEEQCHGLNLPPCYADYMKTARLGLAALGRVTMLRFRERRLEEGMKVYVLGTAVPQAASYVISEGEALEATGTDDPSPLRVMSEEVAAVVRQGEHEKTLIISQESERELSMALGWTANAMIVLGPLLTLFGLGVWLMKLMPGR